MKRLELLGRRFLTWLLAALLSARRKPLETPSRIVVIRLDERVGNIVLLTPLLQTLKARYPHAVIDVVGSAKSHVLLANHPAVHQTIVFDKRSLFAPFGPLRLPTFLRAQRYDLAIEASNPTDPSFTQAIMVRLSGAKHTIGPAHGNFAALFTSPAVIRDDGATHEIDLRLQLLQGLPGPLVRTPVIGNIGEPAKKVAELTHELPTYVVINLGARLAEKTLKAADYAALAKAVCDRGLACVLTWGAPELVLAEETRRLEPRAVIAPATNLSSLAFVMRNAKAVISCDTGPMHIAVAVGTPTCAIFVSTEPKRYGYHDAPHLTVDSRDSRWLTDVIAWLNAL